jgi:hypothetical protein
MANRTSPWWRTRLGADGRPRQGHGGAPSEALSRSDTGATTVPISPRNGPDRMRKPSQRPRRKPSFSRRFSLRDACSRALFTRERSQVRNPPRPLEESPAPAGPPARKLHAHAVGPTSGDRRPRDVLHPLRAQSALGARRRARLAQLRAAHGRRARGQIVLVDFRTYSCVNWLRTLPYVRAWHERYGERGLAVVGAHAPEFRFEHDLDSEPSPKWWNRTRPSRSTRYEEIERAIQLLPGIDEQPPTSPPTVSSTRPARAPCPSPGCISSSATERPPSARSRSRSAKGACAPTCSPSVDRAWT